MLPGVGFKRFYAVPVSALVCSAEHQWEWESMYCSATRACAFDFLQVRYRVVAGSLGDSHAWFVAAGFAMIASL